MGCFCGSKCRIVVQNAFWKNHLLELDLVGQFYLVPKLVNVDHKVQAVVDAGLHIKLLDLQFVPA